MYVAGWNMPNANPKPELLPASPNFSSGPCRKHPGWSLSALQTEHLGRSHRAAKPKARLKSAIDRCRQLMQLPDDWKLGIVPGSDTGAFEMAMWSLLGSRGVDALVSESFSSDWATDLKNLEIKSLNLFEADYGHLPPVTDLNPDNDLVFVYNGTTSGVCLPNLDFISEERKGLTLCDATSAVFSRALDFNKLDVVTWSWQKVLGGEAAHGMLALSPRAVARLCEPAPRALPKLFRMTKNGSLNESLFEGATINTPSMLAVEDLHSALDWAEQCGGPAALCRRSEDNFSVIDQWVQTSDWIDWLAVTPATRSRTSMCLTITDEDFNTLPADEQKAAVKTMLGLLQDNQAAFDIGAYRSAPTGFRIWGGATVESSDLAILTHWLDWCFAEVKAGYKEQLQTFSKTTPGVES